MKFPKGAQNNFEHLYMIFGDLGHVKITADDLLEIKELLARK